MTDTLMSQPRQFGRYSILRELRRDETSATYLASDPVMHRELVLKTVELPPPGPGRQPGEEADTSALEKAFVRQAQAAGKLNHPHIVTVFDAGRVHQTGYLAIERVQGRPLNELIVGGFRPQFVHCASIVARIADAIEYAHGQSVAHGHLQAQHVLLQSDGAPKVEGFGGWIDSGQSGADALHATERLLPYFENEVTGEHRRRDVRAVAALGYMLLTGKAPADRPDPVATLRADVPPLLAQIIDATLVTGTHRSAGDLRDALTAFIWNARKENVAPGTIGIPLGAPPKTPPPDGIASATMSPRTRPRTLVVVPGQRPATRQRTPVAAPPPLAQQVQDWVQQNRVLVSAIGGLIALGILIGVGLGLRAGRGTPPAPPAATEAATAPLAATPVGTGIVRLDIAPWGEVVVDGKPIGVSPPMLELNLAAGRHTIEIRHGDKAAVSAQVDVDPAQPLQIRHRFE